MAISPYSVNIVGQGSAHGPSMSHSPKVPNGHGKPDGGGSLHSINFTSVTDWAFSFSRLVRGVSIGSTSTCTEYKVLRGRSGLTTVTLYYSSLRGASLSVYPRNRGILS